MSPSFLQPKMPLWKNVARGRKKNTFHIKSEKSHSDMKMKTLVLSMERLELMEVRSRTGKKGPGI